ncbi:MAG TPA: VOC family protein [Steroidobacteraceae bacterium]|nr:VOC family protein [Steroidobacteraceae bacterium]
MRVLRVMLLALAACLSGAVAAAEGVTAVDSVGIPVSDLARAEAFYTQVLGFSRLSEREVAGEAYEQLFGVSGLRLRVARLRLGEEDIELMEFLTPRGRPIPLDSHSNDGWFQHIAIIVSDMDGAYARLRQFKVESVSSSPQRLPDWNPNAGGIRAFYFHDLEGNTLEVLQFPSGKGAAKWQRRDGTLFLGIDHTAISVASTEASLGYYRDELGLQVSGSSDNYGTEQEQLNHVSGAHLRITALRAARGPGDELLEYLTPRDGRPMPPDTQAPDHWYWQVNMQTQAPAAMLATAIGRHTPVVSGTLVALPDSALGFHGAFILRDPDGHASLIEDRR